MLAFAARTIGITLGITSVTLLASTGLGIRFDPLLIAVLKGIEAEMAWFLSPIENFLLRPALLWLGELGIGVELQDHWKHVFVLLWLFFGAFAKTTYTLSEPRWLLYDWTWAFLAAMGTATAVGTLPLASNNVLWWSLSGFVLWWARIAAPGAFAAAAGGDWRGVSRPLWIIAGTFVALSFVAPHYFPKLPSFASTQSPGLATLAALIAGLAIACVLFGALIREGEGTSAWQKFFNDRLTRVGFEVLSVLGGATLLALASDFSRDL